MNTNVLSTSASSDAELVSASLSGDREAFGQIVARYQALVCSLAYSATGSLPASEDLAQETFLTAWKQLAGLHEPDKLRAWLCGIARNLIHNSLRQQGREPSHRAESLDEVAEAHSIEPLPVEKTISNEEAAILWRSLEQIPEIYREPLVLFYREHQSIETVAENLDLTEDTVKQRLSRGRKLLQEQFIAFVEGALQRSAPGSAFTLGVVAALPHFTIAAGSSAAGSTALKGSAAGKAMTSAGILASISGLVMKLLPAAAGTWMILKLPESLRERKFAFKSFAAIWVGAVLFPLALHLAGYLGGSYWETHRQAYTLFLLVATFGFVAILGSFTAWMARTQSHIRKEEAAKSANPRFVSQSQPYEYRSPWTFLGLPLVHVRHNCVEGGKTLPAIGWIAAGNRAYGIIFASGTVAVGSICLGPLAIGLVAIGGAGIGFFAFGGFALGVLAMGGASIGYLAFGGAAIGWLGASGGVTLARYYAVGGGAIAEHANDQAAQAFMNHGAFFRNEWNVFDVLIVMCWLLPPALSLLFKHWRNRKNLAPQPIK